MEKDSRLLWTWVGSVRFSLDRLSLTWWCTYGWTSQVKKTKLPSLNYLKSSLTFAILTRHGYLSLKMVKAPSLLKQEREEILRCFAVAFS